MWCIRPPLNPPNVSCLVQFSMPHPKWGPVFPLALLPPIFCTSAVACLVCVSLLGSKIGLPWWCRFGAFSGRGRSSSIFCWPVQPWCLVGCISPLHFRCWSSWAIWSVGWSWGICVQTLLSFGWWGLCPFAWSSLCWFSGLSFLNCY